MEIRQSVWGFTPTEEAIVLYTMRTNCGSEVTLCNIGAGIISIKVPDKNGKLDDVVLGYNNLLDYIGDGACMGKTAGRFANRIAKGRFALDGVEYRLPINSFPNHLHGGPNGFANKIWEGRVEENRVIFSLDSADGDEGYPANLYIEVVYDWSEEKELTITYFARGSGKTVVNLTNHTYFNLAGEDSGSVLDHELEMYSSKYLPTDNTLVPTGELATVKDTPMDFTLFKKLGSDIRKDFPVLIYGNGYDSCWAVDGWKVGELSKVCVLRDVDSGRSLEVYSTQPGVQIYTGNWLSGSPNSKSGRPYNDNEGVAIECQNFPDAPNKPQFPSSELREGEMYEQKIVFKFGVI